jgi:hypothetical protein
LVAPLEKTLETAMKDILVIERKEILHKVDSTEIPLNQIAIKI